MQYKVCGSTIVKNEDVVYTAIQSTKFKSSIKQYRKRFTHAANTKIQNTIEMLCSESNVDVLRTRLSFHQLKNFTMLVDGVKYKNPYDVHVPVGGSNNNNDLVILFAYDHTNHQILLLDIGSHKKLKIGGSTNEIATAVYGGR